MRMLIGVLLAVGAIWFIKEGVLSWDTLSVHATAGVFATISATLLGFLIAALSILVSVGDKTLVANMKRTGHYKVLMDNLFWTAAWLSLAMILALATLFFSCLQAYIMLATIGVFVLGLSSLGIAGYRFYRVVEHLN